VTQLYLAVTLLKVHEEKGYWCRALIPIDRLVSLEERIDQRVCLKLLHPIHPTENHIVKETITEIRDQMRDLGIPQWHWGKQEDESQGD